MSIVSDSVRLVPAGAAGAATASGDLQGDKGELVGVKIDYTSQPATTDVTLTNMGRTVLAVSNANADSFFRPQEPAHDTNGVATAETVPPLIAHSNIDVAVTGGDPGGSVTVTVYIRVE